MSKTKTMASDEKIKKQKCIFKLHTGLGELNSAVLFNKISGTAVDKFITTIMGSWGKILKAQFWNQLIFQQVLPYLAHKQVNVF